MEPGKKRILIIFGIIAAVIFIIFTIFSGAKNRDTLLVNLLAVPEDSVITMDGQTVKNGRMHLVKGEHTFKATRQYFDAVTKTVNTKDLKAGQTIYLIPGATSDKAIQWLIDHPEAQAKREAAGAQAYADKNKQVKEAYPILENLPYVTLDYRIDYTFDQKDNITFIVTLNPVAVVPGTPEYKQQLLDFKKAVLDYMQNQAVDINKVAIRFSPDPDKL